MLLNKSELISDHILRNTPIPLPKGDFAELFKSHVNQKTNIAVLLVGTFICILGSIGNLLVLLTIGRRVFFPNSPMFGTCFKKQKKRTENVSCPQNDESYCPEKTNNVKPFVRSSSNFALRHSSSNLYISLLAINDLMICCLDLPATLIFTISGVKTYDFVCHVHAFFKGTALPISVFVLAMIAVDRTLVICFVPGIHLPRKVVISLLVLMYFISLILGVPFCLRMSSQRGELMNVSESYVAGICGYTEDYISGETMVRYKLAIFTLVIIVLLIIVCMYTAILIFIWHLECRWRKRRNLNESINKSTNKKYRLKLESQDSPTQLDREIHEEKPSVKSIPIDKISYKFKDRKLEKFKPSNINTLDDDTLSLEQNYSSRTNEESTSQYGIITTRKARRTFSRRYQRKPKSAKSKAVCCCCLKKTLLNGKKYDPYERRIAFFKKRSSRRHVKSAIMLALITGCFAISYLPNLLIDNNLIIGSVLDERKYVLYYIYFLNSAMNPIIYSFLNTTFRADMRSILKAFGHH